MSNNTLRSLAKNYARGVINKDVYRKSRSELIKRIVSGDVVVQAINYPLPLQPFDEDTTITETKQRERDSNITEIIAPGSRPKAPPETAQKPVQANKQVNQKSPLLFITISAAIVIVLIIGVVLFYPKPPESITANAANSHTPSSANLATAYTASETLITEFLSEKNWSQQSLDIFIASWTKLSVAEREAAAQTKRMQRLHDSIYKQFLQEKAFASIDSEKAISNQQKLIAFASALDINDARLVLE